MIKTEIQPDGQIAVDMGVPRFEPLEIPFRADRRRARYQALYGEERVEFAALSMGNPHAVIAVDDVEAAPVGQLGPLIQADRSFPNSVNVSFMQILDRGHIRLRVYERGAGETLACGTGACAAAVAGRLWGLLDERVSVSLRGGPLVIQWPETGSEVIMTGPATMVFEGHIEI
jgi:diaminopimelate epimerase